MTSCEPTQSPDACPSFSAVVAAAGAGVRMRARRKKPFLLLDNAPILLHTLWRLRQARGCKGIVLAVHPEDFERQPGSWAETLKTHFGVTAIVAGGATRQASVLAALEATSPDVPLVLTHDAVRPLVRVEVIEAVAARANECGAAIAAAPAVATVKEVGADGFIRQTLPRERLWLAQTPQGFRRELLPTMWAETRTSTFLLADAQLQHLQDVPSCFLTLASMPLRSSIFQSLTPKQKPQTILAS